MSAYYHNPNQQKWQKRRGHARRLFLILALVLALVVVGVIVYIWQSSKPNRTQPVVIQPTTKSYYSGTPQRDYDTDRFSFKSSTVWQLSRQESLGRSRYVFLKQDKNLVDYELDILFDSSLGGQAVNYIMPVTVRGGQMKAGQLSPRCGDDYAAKHKTNLPYSLTLKYQKVTYTCAVTGSGEKAAAGLVGGGYAIPLRTAKGEPANVEFEFVNDSSNYFAGIFQEILNSFKLK